MKKYLLILSICLLLVACSGSGKLEAGKEPSPPPAPPKAEIKLDKLICPQVAILVEAQEVLVYGGAAKEDTNLIAKARMDKVEGDCAYMGGDKSGKGSGIDISFSVKGVAARGAALKGKEAKFQYFVAVVNPSENVLARQLYETKLKFSEKEMEKVWKEPLHVFVPLPKEELLKGPEYRVLIGGISQP